MLTFDEYSCGLTIEEIIKAAALNILYQGNYNVQALVFIDYWEKLHFKYHVDNETLDQVVGTVIELFDMFVKKLYLLYSMPMLIKSGENMRVEIDHRYNVIKLGWYINGSFPNNFEQRIL